jgi:hypothetical protein
MGKKNINVNEDAYFDLIYKVGHDAHLVHLSLEQLEKLNILINVLGELTISGESFGKIKKIVKEDTSNV